MVTRRWRYSRRMAHRARARRAAPTLRAMPTTTPTGHSVAAAPAGSHCGQEDWRCSEHSGGGAADPSGGQSSGSEMACRLSPLPSVQVASRCTCAPPSTGARYEMSTTAVATLRSPLPSQDTLPDTPSKLTEPLASCWYTAAPTPPAPATSASTRAPAKAMPQMASYAAIAASGRCCAGGWEGAAGFRSSSPPSSPAGRHPQLRVSHAWQERCAGERLHNHW